MLSSDSPRDSLEMGLMFLHITKTAKKNPLVFRSIVPQMWDIKHEEYLKGWENIVSHIILQKTKIPSANFKESF